MSSSARSTAGSAPAQDKGLLIGALLRLCHQAFVNRYLRGFEEAGLPPISGAATQPLWDQPEGMRLTEMAELAGITKQSMGELVDQAEAAGVVERVPDPADGRARIVRLTASGRKQGRFTRDLVRSIEAEWSARIGHERFEALRDGLTALVDTMPKGTNAPSPQPPKVPRKPTTTRKSRAR